ncbi:MAG: hypothetical protein ABIG30_03840 [Candidatus Aenigmatarchaeota archaeon]
MWWEWIIEEWSNLGFYEFLLPWLLTFAIVFGLLTKAKLFGDANKKVSGVIALVVAFFVTPYAGPQIAAYFSTLFAGAAVVLSALLVGVLLVAMVGIEIKWGSEKKWIKYSSVMVLILISVVIFVVAAGAAMFGLVWIDLPISLIFLVLLVAIAIAVVMSSEEKESGGGGGTTKPV